MGYSTNFTIETDRKGGVVLDRIMEVSDERWDGDNILRDARWYEHEDDLKKVSAEFPDVLITVTGWGEETGDYWRKYFVSGKMQRVAPAFPECTLERPKMKRITVNVTVLGHDVPIEIEYTGNPTEDELYLQAKQQLKELL